MRRAFPLQRYQAGYVPRGDYRTEDAYFWRSGNGWRFRVNESQHTAPTLAEATRKAAPMMGLQIKEA